MSVHQVEIGGHLFDSNSEHFSFPFPARRYDAHELKKLSQLKQLKSASFSDTWMNDEGLRILSNLTQLENLSIQNSSVTNDGLQSLSQLKNLQYLRLKDHVQLTNSCVLHLLKIEKLKELQIHETSINEKGLQWLIHKPTLTHIVVDLWENNYTVEGLVQFTTHLPGCTVLVKGHGEFLNGKFDGKPW